MNSRRIALTIGAAGGGLVATAFLPVAVAFADGTDGGAGAASTPIGGPDVTNPAGIALNDHFDFLPVGAEDNVTTTSLDDVFTHAMGTQLFALPDTGNILPEIADNTIEGFIATNVSDSTLFGVSNELVNVTNDVSGKGEEGVPGAGSVYDVTKFDGFTNYFSDVVPGGVSTAPGTVTDTLVTPFGTFDLSFLFAGFDGSSMGGDAAAAVDPSDFALF
jgi:hypothetical protein